MAFCYKCGFEIEAGASFCPNCGANQKPAAPAPVYTPVATPARPVVVEQKISGGTRGKSIASIILGGEGIGVAFAAFIFVLANWAMDASLSSYSSYYRSTYQTLAALYQGYAIGFGIVGLISGIIGVVLASGAQQQAPNFRAAKIGKVLSMIALIVSGVALLFSLF